MFDLLIKKEREMVEQRRNGENIYKGKKVLITGHTGFKGRWLALWLRELGARVYGYALEPPTRPSLFEMVGLEKGSEHPLADMRDIERVKKSVQRIKPDSVFHLPVQSLL